MGAIQRTGNSLILIVEKWFNRAFGNHLNPFYHLGSLTFFFFWIVLVSGIYVFIFFETNVAGAYQSVEYMTHDQWWMAGIMRSLHRYASDAAVITIFLHMFREFFRDRYRGVRWFSWFTGVPTLWLVVLLGISGYWLVWDQLAQYVAIATAELLDWLPITPGSMALNFLDGALTDRFFTLMAFLHLLGFPVGMVFLLWTHVSRISQVDFNPPRGLAIGSLAALTLLSIVKPAVSHAPVAIDKAPVVLNIDWFYLNIYPFMDTFGAGMAWLVPNTVTILLLLLPWLPPKKPEPVAVVNLDPCNGCGQCAADCPFGAVSMQPRSDGRKFEFEATVNASLCTSCGICVGACPFSNPHRQRQGELVTGIDMPQLTAHVLREQVRDQIAKFTGDGPKVLVVGCDHGLDISRVAAPDTAILSMPCSGMLPPTLIDYALNNGTDGIFITGCRDGDCYFRIGNHLVDERNEKERKPYLPTRVKRERIGIHRGSSGESHTVVPQLAAFREGLRNGKEG